MDRVANIHILTKRLILMTLVSVLVFAAIFGISYIAGERFMLTWAGFLCGIVGGFVSIQQRLKMVSDEELILLTQSWFSIVLVPIFGGVFALVLYCIFLSEIITGNLFPAFYTPKPEGGIPDSAFMIEMFTQTYPLTSQDFAKFLFWSFAAGFSERLVPQIIGNVTKSATQQSDSSDTPKDN